MEIHGRHSTETENHGEGVPEEDHTEIVGMANHAWVDHERETHVERVLEGGLGEDHVHETEDSGGRENEGREDRDQDVHGKNTDLECRWFVNKDFLDRAQ